MKGDSVHDFIGALAAGQAMELRVIAYLEDHGYRVQRSTLDEDKAGVDFWSGSRRGVGLVGVQVKFDSWTAKTDRLFIETVSARYDDDRPEKSGWLYTTRADWILFVAPGSLDEKSVGDPHRVDRVYTMEYHKLRAWMAHHSPGLEEREARNDGYTTVGRLARLVDLTHDGIIATTFDLPPVVLS